MSVLSDKPSAPLDLRVVDRHKDFVSTTWKVPRSDGGALITGYVVERREGLRPAWTLVGETSSETLVSVKDRVTQYKQTTLDETAIVKCKPTVDCKNSSCVCTTVTQTAAVNSSGNSPSYPLNSPHCSDVIYRGGGDKTQKLPR